ncbi:hypothetical protein EK904_007880 [Melospiza melodia maxima]|nr:hypothetical protein EK904_007880 [Melospiza melodia maxima]
MEDELYAVIYGPVTILRCSAGAPVTYLTKPVLGTAMAMPGQRTSQLQSCSRGRKGIDNIISCKPLSVRQSQRSPFVGPLSQGFAHGMPGGTQLLEDWQDKAYPQEKQIVLSRALVQATICHLLHEIRSYLKCG